LLFWCGGAPRGQRGDQLADIGERERLELHHGARDTAADVAEELEQLARCRLQADCRGQNERDRRGTELGNGRMECAECSTVSALGFIQRQGDGDLVRYRAKERGDRRGDLSPILRWARLNPTGQLRHQRCKHGQPVWVGGRQARCIEQPRASKAPKSAPGCLPIAVEWPAGDNDEPLERQAFEALV
jgi:hypothetical protein